MSTPSPTAMEQRVLDTWRALSTPTSAYRLALDASGQSSTHHRNYHRAYRAVMRLLARGVLITDPARRHNTILPPSDAPAGTGTSRQTQYACGSHRLYDLLSSIEQANGTKPVTLRQLRSLARKAGYKPKDLGGVIASAVRLGALAKSPTNGQPGYRLLAHPVATVAAPRQSIHAPRPALRAPAIDTVRPADESARGAVEILEAELPRVRALLAGLHPLTRHALTYELGGLLPEATPPSLEPVLAALEGLKTSIERSHAAPATATGRLEELLRNINAAGQLLIDTATRVETAANWAATEIARLHAQRLAGAQAVHSNPHD